MKYIGTYSNDTDIATKANVDAKQDKVLANGILQGDGAGTISAAETQEVELVELTKADVGLGNVDNTSDASKPISTATQTALNGKQATITGGASTITTSNLTANRALVSDASGKVAVSDVTSTELGYLDGVTSNIQTQLNGKLSTAPVTSVNSKTGAVELSASDVGAQPTITANGFLKGDGSGNITADKPVFLVNITQATSGVTGTSDKTVAEIITAYEAGYAVYAVCKITDFSAPFIMPLTVKGSLVAFSSTFYTTGDGDYGIGVTVLSTGGDSWTFTGITIPSADNTVPRTRTINTKPLSSNITLTAADVNAVGLTGDQTIAGDKEFKGNITFDNTDDGIETEVYFINNATFQHTSTVNFKGARVFFDDSATVDFTNATVTGLPGLLPTVGVLDNGQFLRVVNGAWAAAKVENANGVSF
nr:MAG TPA: receptor binding complex [Caudoviricetes sp.]